MFLMVYSPPPLLRSNSRSRNASVISCLMSLRLRLCAISSVGERSPPAPRGDNARALNDSVTFVATVAAAAAALVGGELATCSNGVATLLSVTISYSPLVVIEDSEDLVLRLSSIMQFCVCLWEFCVLCSYVCALAQGCLRSVRVYNTNRHEFISSCLFSLFLQSLRIAHFHALKQLGFYLL